MSIVCKGGVLKKRMEVSTFFMNDVLSISAKFPLMDWRKELKSYTPIPVDVLGTVMHRILFCHLQIHMLNSFLFMAFWLL